MLKKIRSLFLYIVLPSCLIELWVGLYLFEHASYTNSTSLDETIKSLHKSTENHEMFFFGDSEVHWGIDPVVFDTNLRASGVQVRSFNFGIDGFSGAINYELLKKLDFEMFKGIKVALIGVQLIEYHGVYPSERRIREDQGQSDLKRPIFLSPFGIDNALTTFSEADKSLLDRSPFRTIRYRKALKSMLLKDSMVINAGFFSPRSDGFSPHLSIRANPENYALDVKRKKEEKIANPKSFSELDHQRWERDFEKGEYFDLIATYFLERDIYPVFFALPTNPWYIDFKNRRSSYTTNSKYISKWAVQRRVGYIDMGILDSFSPEDDFADFRHLSSSGAAQFSKNLAVKISELTHIQTICNSENKNFVRGIRNWNNNPIPEKIDSGEHLYSIVKSTDE